MVARLLRLARHPVRPVKNTLHRLAESYALPVGRTARTRRLLRAAVPDDPHVLVIGAPHAVRQALPKARLDVAGTGPLEKSVTVVSDAMGEASLPRRWNAVVVTDPSLSAERLAAAAHACLPGGLVLLLMTNAMMQRPVSVPGAVVEEDRRTRDVRLVVARVLT